MPRHCTGRRARNHINDFRDEVVKPEHVEQPEDRIGHCPQRRIVAQTAKHLPRENGQHKKEQHRHLEVVGMPGTDLREIIEAAAEHHGAADHGGDFEIREALVIQHPVKFPKR